jgi:hypothetical protein
LRTRTLAADVTRKRGTGGTQVGTYAQVLGGIGTLLAGVAAVIALLVAGGRSDPAATAAAPSSQAPPTSTASAPVDSAPSSLPAVGASPTIPAFDEVLFSHAMTAAIPGIPTDAAYSGCTQQLAAGRGYSIAAEGQALTCQFPLSGASSRLSDLAEVRIDVRADFDRFTAAAAADYTPGGPAILCRITARERGGTHYSAMLGPNGFWQIDRFVDGVARPLGFGTEASLATEVGESRRLVLECAGATGGPTLVRLSVDGREVTTATDPDGLPAGDVGLGIVDYPGPEVAVTFHDVEVSAP